MVAITNKIYDTCHDFSYAVLSAVKPVVNKTIEVSKRVFDLIGQFVLGFCIGTMAGMCYMLFSGSRQMGYSFNPAEAAICAVALGILIGIGMAVESWRSLQKPL